MSSSFFESLFNMNRKRLKEGGDEIMNQRDDDEIIPSAPVHPLDSFHLSKSSFDFTMSQVLTPTPRPTVLKSGDINYKPSFSHQPKLQTPNCRRKSLMDQSGCYGSKPELTTPGALVCSDANSSGKSGKYRSVEEIPYRHIFQFEYFNMLQSIVLDEVLYTDRSVVVTAPTGSGKTAVFEIALIRLLMKTEQTFSGKIIYMAPMKALCTERFQDWQEKFPDLKCLKVTGDSELDDVAHLRDVNLICTTPEKWDSMSRRWKDKIGFFHGIRLFLIDEIHTLNDRSRGATVEAVVSRMKTLQTASSLEDSGNAIRFIAVSATLPNYKDIAEWVSTPSNPASSFNIEEKHRPVKLERFVVGYPFKKGSSDFRFDMNLSYRLKGIIDAHCHGKPTLVFCSSRKSVIQSGEILAKSVHSLRAGYNPLVLQQAAQNVHEQKVSDLLNVGIGVHHAGLTIEDRQTVEDLFRNSQLPVLISTSTLAMGVNLPAHLVVIKSTHFYNMGAVEEYSDMQLLQMIGRAGRPQFDSSATAVIMTKDVNKSRYESLVKGTQLVESSLHKNLKEHLNAEIVLQTITDMTLAVEWMRQTFLYVRVLKNPKYYGLPLGLSKDEVEKRLQDLCLKNLNLLTGLGLVTVEEDSYAIVPQETGRLMARYCMAFETMKQFHQLGDNQESVADMIEVVSDCAEFEDIQLRTNEKRMLNCLNKDKHKESIRFPLTGKIKNKQMKVNCLIQAQLSCLPVQDFSLSQDVVKIFRVGQRVAKCLMEFLYQQGDKYSLLLHAILVYKGLKSKLWFDSSLVCRQLDGIGPTMSLALAKAGLSSFKMFDEANPRDIEVIVNRHPPFGNQIKESISKLPRYELAIEQVKKHSPGYASLSICIDLTRRTLMEEEGGGGMGEMSGSSHQALLLIGDQDNAVVFKWRIIDKKILTEGAWTRTLEVKRAQAGSKLSISLLSLDWVGLDIQTEYEPVYTSGWVKQLVQAAPASKLKESMDKSKLKKNSTNTPKVIKAPVKRAQTTPKAEAGNSKQAKVDSENTPGKADALSTILNDMDRSFPINKSRITLKKFAYEKPKMLSHEKVGDNVSNKPNNQMISVQEQNLVSRFTPQTSKSSNLNESHFGEKNICNESYKIKNENDDDWNWNDDDLMRDMMDQNEDNKCHVSGGHILFQPYVDDSVIGNERTTTLQQKGGNCKGFQTQSVTKGLTDRKRNIQFPLSGKDQNVQRQETKYNPNQTQTFEFEPTRKNRQTGVVSSNVELKQTSSSFRPNSPYHSHSPSSLSVTTSSKSSIPNGQNTTSVNRYSFPRGPSLLNVANSTCVSIPNRQDIPVNNHPTPSGPQIPSKPIHRVMTHTDRPSNPHGGLVLPTQNQDIPSVMGGAVDDFMRQQGYDLDATDNDLPFNCNQKENCVVEKTLPGMSLSDEELYHLAEEQELSHSMFIEDSLTSNTHSVHESDHISNSGENIIEIQSSSSSTLPSPPCYSRAPKPLHHSSSSTLPSPPCYSRAPKPLHHSSSSTLPSQPRHSRAPKPLHHSNSHCARENSHNYIEDHDDNDDDGCGDEISWSPLSSQLSQQIPPLIDVGNQVIKEDNIRNLLPLSRVRGMEPTKATTATTTVNSPHRFGLVQAWPRDSKSQDISRMKFECPPRPRGKEVIKSGELPPPKTKGNPQQSRTASMFLPQQQSPAPEVYVPGKLFDGIFESLISPAPEVYVPGKLFDGIFESLM